MIYVAVKLVTDTRPNLGFILAVESLSSIGSPTAVTDDRSSRDTVPVKAFQVRTLSLIHMVKQVMSLELPREHFSKRRG